MNNKKYAYIAYNIFIFLYTIRIWKNLYLDGESIIVLLLQFIVTFIVLNLFAVTIDFILSKLFEIYIKRSAEKYDFYEWSGKPDSPIDLYKEFSKKKDFDPTRFKENCEKIKEKIYRDLPELDELKSYKTYLELKSTSPRLSSLLSATQTIFIAVIASSLITFLNYTNINGLKMFFSYIFFMLFYFGLMHIIDFMSKAIDRDKLLLVLVNECIEETKK